MENCIHYWKLNQAHKGIVHARCQKCGAEKDFDSIPNYRPGTFQSKKKIVPSPIIPATNA